MKKSVLLASAALMMGFFASCGGGQKAEEPAAEAAAPAAPEYELMTNLPTVDITTFPQDSEGRYVIFDGKTFNGWRGYNKENVPGAWTIEDGCIKINGSGRGEAGAENGGDLIFMSKLKNFELDLEWKVGKGSNSGIFYLIQEVKDQPAYISAPECQVLDNENHPDAKLGAELGIRQSSSLYDMIPAKPQNAKPFGEWNKVKIICYNGSIAHFQNDQQVVEYHLWTPQWDELLQKSKFSKEKWPLAYELLSNCGGENHEGYIGLQDHGDDVWYRNITVKVLN